MKKILSLAPYRNQISFTLLFIVVAILFMTIGFWETILLVLLTGIGYFIGMVKDEQRSISSIIASIQAMFER